MLRFSSFTGMFGIRAFQAMVSKVLFLEEELVQNGANMMASVSGFMEKRFPNGTFVALDPTDCSPKDNDTNRACSLTEDNENGFYESSSWEVSPQ